MPFSLLAPAAALKIISVTLRPEKPLRKAAEARDVFVLAARLLRLDIVEAGLETVASSRLNRYRHSRTASGRLFTALAASMPPAARAQWRDERLGERGTLPARRSRVRFVAHALSGVPWLAVTPCRPALPSRQARP